MITLLFSLMMNQASATTETTPYYLNVQTECAKDCDKSQEIMKIDDIDLTTTAKKVKTTTTAKRPAPRILSITVE